MDNSSLYQSQLLSGLAQRFYNREFIANRIFTQVSVPNLLFQYHTWDSDVVFRIQKTAYGQDGSVNRIDMKATKNSAAVDLHGISADIDPMELNQAPEMAVRAVKTRAIMNTLKLGMEKAMADQLFSTTYITNYTTLSGTTQWSHEDSNPLGAILTAQNGQPVLMDCLLVGKQVHDQLRQHPLILEQVKYVGGGKNGVSADQIRDYLGLRDYIVGDAFVEGNAEGQTSSKSFIWGKKALLFHRAAASNPLMDEVSLGYLPVWGGGGGGSVRVYTSRVGTRGTGDGIEFIKGEIGYKPLLTSVACGYLFDAAVA
jgi:hypothetical protein